MNLKDNTSMLQQKLNQQLILKEILQMLNLIMNLKENTCVTTNIKSKLMYNLENKSKNNK